MINTVAITFLKLDPIRTLALACLVLSAGIWIKGKIRILDRLNIPAAVIGGLVFSALILVMRDRVVNFEFDTLLRDLLMIAFFTTVGLSASLRLLKVGGVQVLIFFVLSSIVAVLQNVIGIGLAKLFGLHPLLGIIAGSVTLTGGPATGLAFGPTFEKMGVQGAVTLALASATFGIVFGGLIGGPIGTRLIERYKLRSSTKTKGPAAPLQAAEAVVYDPPAEEPLDIEMVDEEAEHSPLLHNVIIVGVAMGVGSIISAWIGAQGIVLPAYIGAMIVAGLLRNLDDRFGWFGVSQRNADTIGNISLSIFIAMALMNLKLWELVSLAVPILVILLVQVLAVALVAYTISFWLMGRDYDSAVMASGFCGFMLGTTANAVACMEAIAEKYGPAPRAFLVVPIVGAFLIDFTNALIITTMANFFK